MTTFSLEINYTHPKLWFEDFRRKSLEVEAAFKQFENWIYNELGQADIHIYMAAAQVEQ